MRQSEYVIDRLQAEIQHYKDIADAYESECNKLREECKFGAVMSLVVGISIGVIAGVSITWL